MVSAQQIADFLGVAMTGADVAGLRPRSLGRAEPGAIVFLTGHDGDAIRRLNAIGRVACVTTEEVAADLACTVLAHPAPRLAYCRLLARFFAPKTLAPITGPAHVSPEAVLAPGVVVGAGSVIAEGVRIGPETVIGNNVVVASGTEIGRDCVIKSNTTIGERGFGFARDEANRPVPFPHVGTVRIGDHVEIGANCTVVRAALDATIVEDYVKTDDHVHIAHNVVVGARTMIAAGAVVSGSVSIGADVWIGPNATIIDKITVGDGARIGIGSVVTRPVAAGATVFGNPAKRLAKA